MTVEHFSIDVTNRGRIGAYFTQTEVAMQPGVDLKSMARVELGARLDDACRVLVEGSETWHEYTDIDTNRLNLCIDFEVEALCESAPQV